MRKLVDIQKDKKGNLVLRLTTEGREDLTPEADLFDVLEYQRCNSSLEFLQPEEIGALTSSEILSDEVERDDQGTLLKVGAVYWYPDYAVSNPVEVLLQKGRVVFTRAD